MSSVIQLCIDPIVDLFPSVSENLYRLRHIRCSSASCWQQSSDIIIAINKNLEAPIFNVATYGIIGDVYEIIPLLIKKIKEAKGESL
jgi:hypothetical protein